MPPILDPCCGSRMMWFNKQDQRCLFGVALVNLDAFIQAA